VKSCWKLFTKLKTLLVPPVLLEQLAKQGQLFLVENQRTPFKRKSFLGKLLELITQDRCKMQIFLRSK